MDDGVAALHGRLDRRAAADIAFDEGVFRIFRNVLEIRQVPRVGQFIVINYIVIIPQRKSVADEIRSDEPGPASDQNFHRATPAAKFARVSVPPGILLAPVSATRLLARSSDSNVPASVHQPSRISYVSFCSSI